MKYLYLIALALFLCGNANAQKTDLMQEKILIGQIENDHLKVLADTEGLLLAMNEQFGEKYDKVEILNGLTLGDRKEKFYYVSVSSVSSDSNVVRWLTNIEGKLYIENTMEDESSHKDYYIACRGVEQCKPNVFVDKNEIIWICGDNPSCLTEEGAKRNPCARELSIIVPD